MPQLRLAPPDEWPSLGWAICDWIEDYLCHGPGDVEGEPIELDDEQCRFIVDCYRLYPKGHKLEGRRVGFDATLSRPKGRAKSEVAGMIVCAEASGPVRFSHWGPDGEPVGKRVKSPFIRCLATEQGQAGNTFDNVVTMLNHAVEHFPALFSGLDVGATRILVGSSGEIRPSTSGASSKDGGKETFAVADEIHLYIQPEHRSMLKTVRRNLRKRKTAEPWFLATTTMFKPGQGTPAEARHGWAVKNERNSKRDLSIVYDHREAPKIENWNDDAEILRALADVYGEFAQHMALEGILAEMRDVDADQGDSQRYFLNQRPEYADQAFDLAVWDSLVDEAKATSTKDTSGKRNRELVLPDGEMITIGFDGARFHDSTFLVGTVVDTGYQFQIGAWEDDGTEDWEVDQAEVTEVLAEVFRRCKVWRLYADPPYWETTISEWQGRWGRKRVLEWWTNRPKQIAYACRAFSSAMKAGEISHDGSADLRRHIGNAYREDLPGIKDEEGRSMWRIRKESRHSTRKMDGAMAAVLSWEARCDAVAAGARRAAAASVVSHF